MIELYNNVGTESYGCFDKLKSAGGVLASLASKGVKSVTVSSFRGRKLVRVYRVCIDKGCRIITMPEPATLPAA